MVNQGISDLIMKEVCLEDHTMRRDIENHPTRADQEIEKDTVTGDTNQILWLVLILLWTMMPQSRSSLSISFKENGDHGQGLLDRDILREEETQDHPKGKDTAQELLSFLEVEEDRRLQSENEETTMPTTVMSTRTTHEKHTTTIGENCIIIIQEMSIRGNRLIITEKQPMIFLENEMSIQENETLIRENVMLIRENVMLIRENVMLIREKEKKRSTLEKEMKNMSRVMILPSKYLQSRLRFKIVLTKN